MVTLKVTATDQQMLQVNFILHLYLVSSEQRIVGSGATAHMCFDLSLFTNYHQLEGNSNFITILNVKLVAITLVVTVIDNSDIILEDVLYVPDFKFNLVSFPKLCQSRNCSIIFTINSCFLQVPSMRPQVLSSLKDGMYCLKDLQNTHSKEL